MTLYVLIQYQSVTDGRTDGHLYCSNISTGAACYDITLVTSTYRISNEVSTYKNICLFGWISVCHPNGFKYLYTHFVSSPSQVGFSRTPGYSVLTRIPYRLHPIKATYRVRYAKYACMNRYRVYRAAGKRCWRWREAGVIAALTLQFLQCDAVLSAVYATPIPYICPSVCLSHPYFVSKRLKVSSKFFCYLIDPLF